MKSSTLIKFPVSSFRKIASPYDETGAKTYIAVINVKDVPTALDEWRELNVRDPKINGGVAQKIAETLKEEPNTFFFRNRGMTVIADKVSFDNQSSILSLEMSNKHQNGLLDGGHTYRVIRNFIDALPEEKFKEFSAYVKIEILEGLTDRADVVDVVESRNTSQQVKEQSIQELLGSYEGIKKALDGLPYSERVAYKEYELLEDGSKKTLDIKEILSYLYCFDTETFDDNSHPLSAYSTKWVVVNHFKEHGKRMEKYYSLLPIILELRDEIYHELPNAYNLSGGKFGLLTGVIPLEEKKTSVVLPFTGKKSEYQIPSGFIYPVLASFRNLVKNDNKHCEWKSNPIKMFNELKKELAERVGVQAKEFRNPNKLGKDVATWQLCYYLVQLETLKRKL